MSSYPEHEKLKRVVAPSQACGDFLSWLREVKDWCLARPHVHDDSCRSERRPLFFICDYGEGELEPVAFDKTKLLAEFFGVDLDRLEAEKEQMLEQQRALNERPPQAL